ncbi:ribose-5-phosphate isomerase RpiA [Flaviflexus massiliensis]|uniref:ribose-5-phosphate isomerase RpiA n=1 Tax=Flaviflexus massiliensis TaxID=1522309 RepID=UPI0006D541B4|nr:ribose-5-phosphate isomerase RpiA [Flaviflexus massiliensis]
MSAEQAKIAAGIYAASLIEDGQKVGLGSGTSAWHFIRALAKRIGEGLNVVCSPASSTSRKLALELGVPLVELDELDELDVCVDGADEIAPDGSMIKGGGANLLWEKIIATNSAKMLTVVDPSKVVTTLGAFPLPIEVTPAYYGTTIKNIASLLERMGWSNVRVERRMTESSPVITDNDNYIVDAHLGTLTQPLELAIALNQIPGVVENGIFPAMSSGVIVGREDGTASLVEPGFNADEVRVGSQ